jgi:hypothetical protein
MNVLNVISTPRVSGVLTSVILLVMADMMGITPLLVSAYLYSIAFLLGHGINRRFRCVVRLNRSPFELMGILAFEAVIGIGLLTLSLFFVRVIGLPDWLIIGPASVTALGIATFRARTIWKAGPPWVNGWEYPRILPVFLLALLLAILALSDSFGSDGADLYFREAHHPFYELSIGNSTTHVGLSKPDLSYAGKTVQLHMLGPIWASVMNETLGLAGIVTVFRVIPVWQIMIGFALMSFLARRLSGDDLVAGMTPILAFFLTAFLVVPLGAKLFEAPIRLFFEAFVIQPSTSLGMTGLLAFIALNISTRHEMLKMGPLTIGMILAAFTFFSKTPLIIPFMLALGFWATVDLVVHRRWPAVIYTLSFGIAILPFGLMILGGHEHNYWALIPHYQYFTWFVNLSSAYDNLFLQLLFLVLSLPIGTLGVFGVLPFGVLIGWRLGADYEVDVSEGTRPSSNTRLVFVTAGLAFLVSGLVSEMTEGNHVWFGLGYSWIGFLGVLMWLRTQGSRRWLIMPTTVFLSFLMLYNIAFIARPVIPYSPDQDLSINPLVVRAKMAVVNNIPKLFGREPGRSDGDEGFFINNLTRFLFIPRQGFSGDLQEALESMRQLSTNAIVMRGRHYEDLNWQNRSTSTQWWPSTSFFATAVSGNQYLIENFKYKGLSVQDDYIDRSRDVFRFYWWCGDRRQNTSELSQWTLPPGGPPLGDVEHVTDLSLVRLLTIKGNPSWFTAVENHYGMLLDLSRELVETDYSLAERADICRSILEYHNVSDIVFERGEKPDPYIADILGLAPTFSNTTVTIYQYPKI